MSREGHCPEGCELAAMAGCTFVSTLLGAGAGLLFENSFPEFKTLLTYTGLGMLSGFLGSIPSVCVVSVSKRNYNAVHVWEAVFASGMAGVAVGHILGSVGTGLVVGALYGLVGGKSAKAWHWLEEEFRRQDPP